MGESLKYMERIAFKLQIKKGSEINYFDRQNEVWPEFTSALKKAGIFEYSIFFDDDTNYAFVFMKVDEIEIFESLSFQEIVKKWWGFLDEFLVTSGNQLLIDKALEEIYYLA